MMDLLNIISNMGKEKLKIVLPEIIEQSWENLPDAINQAMRHTGIFKCKVSESGRITIPQAEREALEIEEGEIVQVVLRKVELKK